MIEIPDPQNRDLTKFFPDSPSNFLATSILEGHMGQVLADDAQRPNVVVLTLPNIKYNILGGDAGHPAAREYLEKLPRLSPLFFGAPGWKELFISVHANKLVVRKRYAFSSQSLDPAHLRLLRAKLAPEFTTRRIDLPLAQQIAAHKEEITKEQLFGFKSAEDFMQRGIGYAAFDGNRMVCIAAAGSACSKGIEIQINTNSKYQGRGLASAVGAELILWCLENGIDPNWDAATEISAGLARKLGYTSLGAYDAYHYVGSKFLVTLINAFRRLRGKEI
ncbi:MAG: GNAT family N-acetyltransferase [Anaerolineae bacterium]|nr:MAG: GNAT family N-acetyltransferase [Anaerolineae bacterium]